MALARNIWGRVRQTMLLVLAWWMPVDDELARAYLSDSEYNLYVRMSRAARQHHLRVLKQLLSAGHTEKALLKAALLHDVGKIRYPFGLPEKVLVVLTKKAMPHYYKTWGEKPPQGWKRPFVVSRQHPQWSAEMAAAVGTNPITLELIRRHQDKPITGDDSTDHLLRLLQWADDLS